MSCWRVPSLRRPAPQVLFQLFAQDVPLPIENRSKAARGFALQRRARTAPVRSRPAALSAGMSVSDAFKAVMRANLAHLQANERGMLAGGDPEHLHQMRVALRRLRSAIGVFGPVVPEAEVAPVAAELKWLAASLGRARDWDVFVTQTLPPIEREFGAQGELKAFSKRCRELQRGANLKSRRAVRTTRYQRLMRSLAGWLTSEDWLARLDHEARAALKAPVGEFAAMVLERRYHQVRKRGRKLGGLAAAELHRLRIAIKKFRYAADFFAGLYQPTAVREALKRLSRLQNILGAMNDAATVTDLMAHGFGSVAGRRMLGAKGILLGWSRRRMAALKHELRGAWKEFRAAEKFW